MQPARNTLRPTPPQVDPNEELAKQQKQAKRMQQLMMLATIGSAVQQAQQGPMAQQPGMMAPPPVADPQQAIMGGNMAAKPPVPAQMGPGGLNGLQ